MYQSSWGLSFLPKKSYCFKFWDKKEFIFFNYLVQIYLTTLLAVETVVKNLGQWGRSRLNSAETIYTKVRCPLNNVKWMFIHVLHVTIWRSSFCHFLWPCLCNMCCVCYTIWIIENKSSFYIQCGVGSSCF